MSHPLIIEAIETCFVPLCIYNSARGGSDRETLRRFKERPMNYPVVRIIDKNEKKLIERIPDYRSGAKLLDGMVKAIEKAKREVPEWLKLFREEMVSRCPSSRKHLQQATFAMG